MYVNGPMARQIGVDSTQGMTTEECNIGIGRFMELALINLAGIKRNNAFGNVQPLVFSENDELCLKIGWKPHHVEKGYQLNDNVITATSFSMWGNNITPATDLPEEIMKVMAWDITEKNLGGLGSASVDDNADTKRLIFITESVATALSAKYKSKDDLENALVANARRPLWMRTYAYYYANTGGALGRSFDTVYNELKGNVKEDARLTASPAWMNGITYSNIDTVATMTKGNTDIILTGDSSRNKTQVMPGGVSVIGASNDDGTYRTMTFVNGGDGTYTVKYNSNNTLETNASSFYLKLNDNGSDESLAFEKTGSDDVITLTKELPAGTYQLAVYDPASKTECGNSDAFTDTAYRTPFKNEGEKCAFTASGGKYEFKYEIPTKRLSVYFAQPDIVPDSDTDTQSDNDTDVHSDTSIDGQSDNDTDVHSDTSTDVQSDHDTDVHSDTSTDIQSDHDTDVHSDTSTDVQSDHDTDIHSDTGTDVQSDHDTDVHSDTSTDTQRDTDSEAGSDTVRHVWSEPRFTWYENNKSVAVFTCDSDRHHTESVDAVVTSNTTPADCETDGKIVYTATVRFDGKAYTDTKTEVIPKIGHSYGKPEWTWNGYQTVYASFTCSNGKTHTEYINATVTSKTTAATCESDGETVYTAAVEFNGKKYTDTKTLTLSRKGHSYKPSEWKWEGLSKAAVTLVCENDSTHTKTVDADITCETTEDGKTLYTATVVIDGDTFTDTKTGDTPILYGLLGDVDSDRQITANDALMILRSSVGLESLTPEQEKLADVDGDGEITANDALAVLRYSVGLAEANTPINRPIDLL